MDIPVIDVSHPDLQVGEALVAAATEYGFVFIKNEGSDISPKLRGDIFELSRQFFALPREEKGKWPIGVDNKGWSSMHSEKLDPKNHKNGDFKEGFNFGEFSPTTGHAQQPLPPVFASHESEINEFYAACHNLCRKLLRLFALGLKVDPAEGGEEWFSSRHNPSQGSSGRVLRLLHYPPTPPSSISTGDIRAGAHSDYGSLTLLFRQPNQPGGLEILPPTVTSPQSPSSTAWVPVPTYPPGTATEADPTPPILVNIGDLLEYWTNGLLKSTVHRVVFPPTSLANGDGEAAEEPKARYSIGYFCHPVHSTLLSPVPSPIVAAKRGWKGRDWKALGETDLHKVITAEEHLKTRLAITYGWREKEKEKEREKEQKNGA